MLKTPCEYCACFSCLMPKCEHRVACGKCVSSGYEKIKRVCSDKL